MNGESPKEIAAEAQITVRNLTLGYGSVVLMRDLNFTVKRGDVFIIMGGSGCGKSTLLRNMIGLIEPIEGEIFYEKANFTRSRCRGAAQLFSPLRRPVSKRRSLEFPDSGRKRRAAAGRIHRSKPGRDPRDRFIQARAGRS